MEKEPRQFSEERAKEIMEAEGLEERSQAEQDVFEAGEKVGLERKNIEKQIREESIEKIDEFVECRDKVIEKLRDLGARGSREISHLISDEEYNNLLPKLRENFAKGNRGHDASLYQREPGDIIKVVMKDGSEVIGELEDVVSDHTNPYKGLIVGWKEISWTDIQDCEIVERFKTK